MRSDSVDDPDFSVEQFLLHLKSQDVRVGLNGERLKISAPKGGLPADVKETLAARKDEIIRFMRRAEGGDEAEPIAPRSDAWQGADLPLSFDQQRIWFLHQLNPHGSAFHLQTSLVLQAEPAVVEQAWNDLLARHEILRTTYVSGVDGPVQRIGLVQRVSLPLSDLSALDTDAAVSQAMADAARQSLRQPFDLTQGPVWRVQLFRLRGALMAAMVFIHHIATDGWSLARLKQELHELCDAHAQRREPQLGALPIQYADYAVWQRERLQGEVLERQLAYWRERLAGMPQALELPLDFARPAVHTGNGSAVTVALPQALARELRGLAQRRHVTPFMLLLTLYKVLLARHSGEWDVVVGTPIAGRARPELEHVQGLFLNSLVLRTSLRGNPGFAEALQQVRDTALGAFAHQDLPFEKLVNELQPRRDLSRNPLFQAIFNMLVDQSAASAGDGGAAQASDSVEGSVQVDLVLDVMDAGDQIRLSFSYNTDLFREETIRRLAQQYERLAQSVVEDEQARVGELALLGDEQRRQMLQEWNATEQAFGLEPVSRVFERQARLRASEIAVQFEDQRLTYAELNARANRLARHLKSVTSGPFKAGIHLHRGVEMVVAVLAVMKAGGAYVPLDPAYPADRIDYMLGDSEAAVLISQASLLEGFNAGAAKVISVDGDAASIAEHSADDLETGPAPEDLAYMIYTSGSTGKPKGVQIEHRALSNFIASMAQRPGLTQDDALLAVTTLSFDIAGLELYLPLSVGARIVLASRETATDGRALAKLMDDSGATVLQATPATWRLLIAAGWQGDKRLKALCGGEALPRELAEQLLQRCGQLWNMYGPTETTIWSTVHQVTSGTGAIPVGKPIANTQVYVLDEYKQPMPIGVAGDLYIGGTGVARGYWNRPELTAERFIDDPFKPGQKLYCTGDRARFLADGSLDYLGRLDGQVKLRGYRIELGEIEAVIEKTAGVAAAVAAVHEKNGDQRLVAYVVRKQGHDDVNPEALKEAAAKQLPSFMVPTAWVFLKELPLTPNGKVDRKALPAPSQEAARSDAGYIAPRTPTERALAAIWADVLSLEKISADDNFFDIGGHSLLAMQAIDRLRQQTGLSLNPRNFYLQTLGQLAASVAGDAEREQRQAAPLESRSTIGLEPFFFGADSRRLFGLIRRAPQPRGQGIVICPPHAHEYVRCHRALRELAQRLAWAGFDVMTFDYFGTGDSAGDHEDGTLTGWRLDVATAVDEAKRRLNLDAVSLLGLRMGATLASLASRGRGDVRALGLWDPIVLGADIEVETAEILSLQALPPDRQHDIDQSDVLGYPLGAAMATDIAHIDLCTDPPARVPQTLVLETGIDGNGRRLIDCMRALGLRAEHRRIDEGPVWKREPYQAIVPREAMATLQGWLEDMSQ